MIKAKLLMNLGKELHQFGKIFSKKSKKNKKKKEQLNMKD
jgi:hypothetical protein